MSEQTNPDSEETPEPGTPGTDAAASGGSFADRWSRVGRGQRWGLALALGLVVVVALGSLASGGERNDHEHSAEAHAEGTIWTCSMHPQIRQPEPGQCPICGMDLIPLEPGGETTLGPDQVALSERAKALAAVRTTPVRRIAPTGARVRLQGEVDYDETTLQTLSAWIPGRIDRLHLDTTGERVRRGQVVATIYSPEVYAAQQDLIAARRQLTRLSSGSELSRSAAEATLESARERLRLLGLPASEVERMEAASSPGRHVAIRSPASGTVIERLATEGAYVSVGAPLYRVADLTRLWVQLDAYESDLPHLEVGQTVELAIEALPGEIFEGRVAFVDPVLDARRRTARVRIAVGNPDRKLRPGMFVEAVVGASGDGDTTQPLVVPASAPLFTGRRSIVYVEIPEAARPTYEARVVRLGPRVGDLYPVVAGLREGERVVTRGAFALDADLQIRGGDSMMTHGDDEEPGPYDAIIAVDQEWRAALAPVFDAYLSLQSALAADDLAGAREAAGTLTSAANGFEPSEPAEAVAAWGRVAMHLRMHGQRADEAATLEEARAQFEPLTEALVQLLRVFGNPTGAEVFVAHCPMAFDNRGAIWVQAQETIDNSYFGSAMRTCGSVEAVVAPRGYLGERAVAESSRPRAAPTGGHQH